MGASIRSYRDLDAWRQAYALSLLVYRETAAFPEGERFGLVSQMRRGAVAVPSNIAEGYGRGSRPDYVRFLRITRGALYELDTQARLAADLGFLGKEAGESLLNQVDRVAGLVGGLLRSLA